MSKSINLLADKSPNTDCAKSNKIHVSASDYSKIPEDKLVTINGFMFLVDTHPSVKDGTVCMNTEQRRLLNCSLQQSMTLKFERHQYICTTATLEMSWLSKAKSRSITIDADQLRDAWKQAYQNIPFNVTQKYMMKFNNDDFFVQVVELEGGKIDKNAEISPKPNIPTAVYNANITKLTFKKEPSSQIIIEDNSVSQATTVFRPDFNFEDLGIGGLDKEFATLFRRAFNSRLYPPKFIRDRGIKHVKGILLYGPPGTGKTLMARQIGKMLNACEPKIVNGPEIFDKMVGESERKIRELFLEAEQDQAQNGDNAQLHLIIFDEFDSICRKRGGTGTLSGVTDTIVNQLLSKIDGVNSLDDVLLIGMTNRKDLIDDAILRPGRLEVQLMINLPDEAGREQIFSIHTKKLRESGGMADDVSLKELAALTPNYTGAEIEGVVKSAQSYSLSNGFDPKTLKLKDAADLKVTRQHFMLALQEVRPAFGIEEDVAKLCPRGIVHFSKSFKHTQKHVSRFIDSLLNSDATNLMSFCIYGKPGSGLTAFAINIATSGFTYVKLILAKNFIGRSEDQISNEILSIFQNAYKSKSAAIVIDDLDAIIEFSPIGPRFANKILQSILVLLKQTPPQGSKLAIFTTTSNRQAMSMIGVDSRYFYEEIELEPITSSDQLRKIAKEACNVEISITDDEVTEANNYLSGTGVPIKRAIEAVDFAAFEAKGESVKWSHLFKQMKQHIK